VNRLAVGLLSLFFLSAAGADLLASDYPLAMRLDDQVYLFPCVTRPTSLRLHSRQTLHQQAAWLIATPIPFGPNETATDADLEQRAPPPWAPDSTHWLGSDELGRDVLARLIHGARVSLFIALVTVLIAVGVGLIIGASAGYFGGVIDLVLSRVIEVMTTFPTVFFLIALLSVLRTQSLWPLVLVLGLTRWPDVARLARAETLRLKTLDFVLAARAMGASAPRIVGRHIIPNALGPVIVAATFAVGSTLLLETALSFLGLGVAPPTASWGELLTEAHRTLISPGAWWLAVFPGLALAVVVLCVNRVGESLQHSLTRR